MLITVDSEASPNYSPVIFLDGYACPYLVNSRVANETGIEVVQ